MSETSVKDPFAAWRDMIDQQTEAWTKLMSETMGTEAFAAALGRQMESYLSGQGQVQRRFLDMMEQYLRSLNLPSRSELARVAAQVGAVEAKVDELDQRFDGLDQRLGGLDQRFDGLGKRFDGLDERLGGLNQRFDGLGEHLKGLQAQLQRVERQTSAPDAAQQAALRDVRSALGALEARVAQLAEQLGGTVPEPEGGERPARGRRRARPEALPEEQAGEGGAGGA